ncbi:hypothetical protein VNO78_15000 [Psophocarpus tetragonolobus]|uniref:Uncharacterized protein n=1 Tax=Psophocarpus tetragonolobus TaxID=3891 RepID=A0AAN9SIV8_PSOTE
MYVGLNRCRKSCRLRWLNYLKPNIKRGDFSEDEIDLMIRMHKLLGNRWSLIAGRLPGRTSTDVKNYWNTYTRRKLLSHKKDNIVKKHDAESTEKPHQVIKPVPRTLSTSPCLHRNVVNCSKVGISEQGATSSLVCGNWWNTLLHDKENNDSTCVFGKGDGVLDLSGEDLTSFSCDFFNEDEIWTDVFLNLGN